MTDDLRGKPAADAADEQPPDNEPSWHRQAVNASWALAARDAAIETGDAAMAARFAAEAREAIAAAVDAGATPAELAWELDYPGGHAALDGAHIDRQITRLRAAAATAADNAREETARQEQLVR
jgi:hypothetical protein